MKLIKWLGLLLIVFLLLAAILPGCQSEIERNQQTIVGKWGDKDPQVNPPVQVEVGSPDIVISISESMIESCAESIIGEGLRIELTDAGVDVFDSGYIELTELSDIQFQSGGTMLVSINCRLHAEKFFKATTKVNELSVNLYPFVAKNEGRYFLKFAAAVSYIDLDDTPPAVEKAMANLINFIASRQALEEDFALDINDLVRVDIENPLAPEESIGILSHAAVKIANNQISILGKR